MTAAIRLRLSTAPALEASDDEKMDGSAAVTSVMVIAWGAGPAAAEWNFDLYGGAAWIQNADLDVRGQDSRGESVNLTIFDLDTK